MLEFTSQGPTNILWDYDAAAAASYGVTAWQVGFHSDPALTTRQKTYAIEGAATRTWSGNMTDGVWYVAIRAVIHQQGIASDWSEPIKLTVGGGGSVTPPNPTGKPPAPTNVRVG